MTRKSKIILDRVNTKPKNFSACHIDSSISVSKRASVPNPKTQSTRKKEGKDWKNDSVVTRRNTGPQVGKICRLQKQKNMCKASEKMGIGGGGRNKIMEIKNVFLE